MNTHTRSRSRPAPELIELVRGRNIPAAIISAELLRRRKVEIIGWAQDVLAQNPAGFQCFLESLSDRDFELLVSEIKRLTEEKTKDAS